MPPYSNSSKYGTAEERAAMLPKLKLIKKKNAARILELSRSVLRGMREIEAIEDAMEAEATADVHKHYDFAVPEFKMTFEATYTEFAAEEDDMTPRLENCIAVLKAIEADAADAAAAVEAADAAAAVEAVAAAAAVEAVAAAAAVEAVAAVE